MCTCDLCFHRMSCEECTITAHGDMIDTDGMRYTFGVMLNNGQYVETLTINTY